MENGSRGDVVTKLLLATDFDGTVADIVDDPSAATLDPHMRELLIRAASCPDIDVALVSGRDVDDLAARAQLEGAWLAGSHGREVRRDDGSWLLRAEPLAARPDPELLEALRRAGFRIEEKKFGLAIHWREHPEIADDDPLIDRFAGWARGEGLELISGRKVAEARMAGGDKKEALERIAAELEPERVVYAGDDLTDFPALEWTAKRGRAIFAASAERQPPPDVEIARDRTELLAAFEEELANCS